MVTIYSMVFVENAWHVSATVQLPYGILCGPYVLDLPDSANQSELEVAVLSLFGISG
jgi:hypothetical protein